MYYKRGPRAVFHRSLFLSICNFTEKDQVTLILVLEKFFSVYSRQNEYQMNQPENKYLLKNQTAYYHFLSPSNGISSPFSILNSSSICPQFCFWSLLCPQLSISVTAWHPISCGHWVYYFLSLAVPRISYYLPSPYSRLCPKYIVLINLLWTR